MAVAERSTPVGPVALQQQPFFSFSHKITRASSCVYLYRRPNRNERGREEIRASICIMCDDDDDAYTSVDIYARGLMGNKRGLDLACGATRERGCEKIKRKELFCVL